MGDASLNPKPLKPEDFDDLLWPAHERYMADNVALLGEGVVQLQSPATAAQRDELVQRIMHVARFTEQATGDSTSSAGGPAAEEGLRRRCSGESNEAPSQDANASPATTAAAEAERPPYWQRFVYQLFVMFFMTLLPWWNPNPHYL